MRWHPSPNWNQRPEGASVDTLILHYTGMPNAEAALDRLCDPGAEVSAHYMIDEDGDVLALVDEEHRAWHAGVSSWHGRSGLNDTSIGIELVNPGHEWGYRPFPEMQMRACIELCQGILKRWPIRPCHVLAHADVAPDRKEDPGELFNWYRLAEEGIGCWPDDVEVDLPDIAVLQERLAAYGYSVPSHGRLDGQTRQVVVAFQRHFMPEKVDGEPDRLLAGKLEELLRMADGA